MTKKKTLRLRRRSRKTGGGLNCNAEGFTDEIAEATSGAAYRNAIVNHNNSEKWPYEQLVDISTRGLVGWYCKKAGLTPEECSRITSMPEVQILGAFFHRYKVFSEHIGKTKTKLSINGLFGSQKKCDGLLNKIALGLAAGKHPAHFEALSENFAWVNGCFSGTPFHVDFMRACALIEKTIDKVQCLLWVIVKNKGLPQGFVMDARIKKFAETPIILGKNDFPDIVGFGVPVQPAPAILLMGPLIKTVFEHQEILEKPPVTFGVY